MPSIGEESLADRLEGKQREHPSPKESTISAINVLHCIQPQLSNIFPYSLLKNKYPTHVPFGLFIFLQLFSVLDDKVLRPKSYTVEEYSNRVVIFILRTFLMIVIPSICYAQLCYLGKLEKRVERTEKHQIALSEEAKEEMTKIFNDRKVSLSPFQFIYRFKPLLKFRGIEITDYQVLIHSMVFPIFIYYLGLFHSSSTHQPIGAIQSWRQRLEINGIQIMEVWECIAVTVILFLSGVLKDLYCLENHLATLIAETGDRDKLSMQSKKCFQAVRHRWIPIDLYLYGVSIFYAILTLALLLHGDSFIPKYYKMDALEQNVWNILTVLITIMQLGGSSASPDVKAFSIVGYFAIPLITLFITGFTQQIELPDSFQFAPGNVLLLMYTTQLVSVLSWFLCLFHCYWRQNELKTWSYHFCLVAIALVVLCLASVTVREFKHYNFNNFCTCKCDIDV